VLLANLHKQELSKFGNFVVNIDVNYIVNEWIISVVGLSDCRHL